MMSWPADSSLSVTITPEMPSMGHGSPNNINPVHVGKGHYKGKVNLILKSLKLFAKNIILTINYYNH